MRNFFKVCFLLLFVLIPFKSNAQELKVNYAAITTKPAILFADFEPAVKMFVIDEPVGRNNPRKIIEGINFVLEIQQIPGTNTIVVSNGLDEVFIIDLSGKQSPVGFQGLALSQFSRPFYMVNTKTLYSCGFGKMMEYRLSMTGRTLSMPSKDQLAGYYGYGLSFKLNKSADTLYALNLTEDDQRTQLTVAKLDKAGRLLSLPQPLYDIPLASVIAVDNKDNLYVGVSENEDTGQPSQLLKISSDGVIKKLLTSKIGDNFFLNYDNRTMVVEPQGTKLYIARQFTDYTGIIIELSIDGRDNVSQKLIYNELGVPTALCYFQPVSN